MTRSVNTANTQPHSNSFIKEKIPGNTLIFYEYKLLHFVPNYFWDMQ